MQKIYTTLATYNQRANQRLYLACPRLEPASYHRDRQAFLTSIHGTLNHLLLTEWIWLGRFTDTPYPFASLRDELYPTLPTLLTAREQEDRHIRNYVDRLDEMAIANPIAYNNSASQRFQQPFPPSRSSASDV